MKYQQTLFACALLALSAGACNQTAKTISNNQELDRPAIEKLHQQEVAATMADDSKALADLWADDAVRIPPGRPADIGKQAILAADERDKTNHPKSMIVSYVPEFKEVKIDGDSAFEWGSFKASYRETPESEVEEIHGSLFRVLRKQSDGSWKFARVMWNLQEDAQ